MGDLDYMMSEIYEEVAELCHEVNRAYCRALGDDSQPAWKDAPQWQKDSAVAGVRLHAKEDLNPEDSHASWMKHKIDEGWIYGEVKDAEMKIHPCLCPYNDLPPEQKAKDYIFKAICDFNFRRER